MILLRSSREFASTSTIYPQISNIFSLVTSEINCSSKRTVLFISDENAKPATTLETQSLLIYKLWKNNNLLTKQIFMSSESEYIRRAEATRVRVLSEALPYIQQFAGRTVVVKYGGAAMKDQQLKDKVVRDIVFLSCVGLRPVVVHGGGPEINSWLTKLGIEPQFKDGLRVTDAPTMDVVEMVLVGRVNKELVSLINRAGGAAVGLCGKDGNLIKARPEGREGIGFVGEVSSIDTKLVESLVSNGYVPVISSVAADSTGQAYNINADTVAGETSSSFGGRKINFTY